MTEVVFYHTQHRTMESALPPLLEKSLERGWRVVVQAGSEERLEALDAHLWTYRDGSFLPHGTTRDRDAAKQPIVLTVGADNVNRAQVRFLIDGVDVPEDAADYERIVVLFDGDDRDAVTVARARWQDAKRRGLPVVYWQQNGEGRWERKMDPPSDS